MDSIDYTVPGGHSHIFLGSGHDRAERRSWAVIWLCLAMMVLEIGGGGLFGSIALVADGLHMSTHAGALLLAALAYRYARRHAEDPRFSFGTGKLGDLAGFTSAVVLALIAVLIGYEAVRRLMAPVPIQFAEAIPIAALGLVVNVVSAFLLAGGHHHDHDDHDHDHGDDDGAHGHGGDHDARGRDGHGRDRQETWLGARDHDARGRDGHGHDRDNNMRAALVHVAADAAVSVLVIVGLLLARAFGWSWMDPLAGIVGAVVIASWAWGLVRDTGAILLDMVPDASLAGAIRKLVAAQGDVVADLHLWRLGPGHLSAIVAVRTQSGRTPGEYRAQLVGRFHSLAHVTVEIERGG